LVFSFENKEIRKLCEDEKTSKELYGSAVSLKLQDCSHSYQSLAEKVTEDSAEKIKALMHSIRAL
jgi:hypothetical protein